MGAKKGAIRGKNSRHTSHTLKNEAEKSQTYYLPTEYPCVLRVVCRLKWVNGGGSRFKNQIREYGKVSNVGVAVKHHHLR